MEQPSAADVWADARRLGLRSVIPGLLAIVVWYTSLRILRGPGLSDSARTFWMIIPIPLFVVSWIAWSARSRRAGELEMSIEHQASTVAWRFTFYWLLGLSLFEAASGFPIRLPTGGELGWSEVVFWPCFVWAMALAWARRRVFATR